MRISFRKPAAQEVPKFCSKTWDEGSRPFWDEGFKRLSRENMFKNFVERLGMKGSNSLGWRTDHTFCLMVSGQRGLVTTTFFRLART